MAGVVGSRRNLIFVISELYYEVSGRHFVVGGKIAGCRHILTGLHACLFYSTMHLAYFLFLSLTMYISNTCLDPEEENVAPNTQSMDGDHVEKYVIHTCVG